jgi:hypothetical protein
MSAEVMNVLDVGIIAMEGLFILLLFMDSHHILRNGEVQLDLQFFVF